MSLKVWLPLTGNLDNKGSSNVTVTNTGATVNTTGKIGSCYSFGTASSYMTLPASCMTSFTECSVCFWLNITSWNTAYATFFQAGKGSSPWNNYVFGFLRNNTNSTCCFTISDASNSSQSSFLTPALSTGTWYHIALVYKSGHCLIYINGSLHADNTTSIVPAFSAITKITIGTSNATGSYQTNCLMNDVRIYNHALSTAEVHKIAQGLVCHYKLDLPNENLLANSIPNSNSTSSWYSAGTGWANSVVANSFSPSGYVIRCTYSGTSATQGGLYHSVNGIDKVVNGAKYTLSAWVRASKACQATFCQEQMVSITPSNTINLTTSWNFVSCTGTIDTSKTYKACILYVAGSYVTQNMWIECCNMKFEAGEKATTWCPHTSDALYNTLGYNSTAVKDSSGYGNNGTITGTITSSTDSAKYSSSAQFSNSSYITHKMPENMYYATYSFWIKAASYTAYGMVYGPINNPSGGTSPWFAINTESSSLWAYFGGNSPSYTKVSGTLSTNVWHHCVYVWNNGVARWYLDGNAVGNAVTYTGKTYVPNTTNATIGDSYTGSSWSGTPFAGQISDFRIYATALSAEDIRELYLVEARNNNKNTMHGYSFNEVLNEKSITNEGNVNFSRISEGYKNKVSFYKNTNPNLLPGQLEVVTTKAGSTVIVNTLGTIPAATIQSLAGKKLTMSYEVCAIGTRYSTEQGQTAWNQTRYGLHGSISISGSANYPFADNLNYSGDKTRVSMTWTVPTGASSYGALGLSLQNFDKPASTNGATWFLKNVKIEVGASATPYVESTWMSSTESGGLSADHIVET